MKCLISPVFKAHISIKDSQQEASINKGLLIYVCFEKKDQENNNLKLENICKKICTLKLFQKETTGKIEDTLVDIQGDLLLVSNFTLTGRNKKGNSIDFMESAEFIFAKEQYESMIEIFKTLGISIKNGVFGAHMTIGSTNEGPINYFLEF